MIILSILTEILLVRIIYFTIKMEFLFEKHKFLSLHDIA
jgi:hypothetical protein